MPLRFATSFESFSGSTPFQIKSPQPIKPYYSDQHPNSPNNDTAYLNIQQG